MAIEFVKESKEIIWGLRDTDDYLGAEKIMINKIKKHLNDEIDIPIIESHLHELLEFFEAKANLTLVYAECVKYMYVTAFIKTLLKNDYWHSWINSSINSKIK